MGSVLNELVNRSLYVGWIVSFAWDILACDGCCTCFGMSNVLANVCCPKHMCSRNFGHRLASYMSCNHAMYMQVLSVYCGRCGQYLLSVLVSVRWPSWSMHDVPARVHSISTAARDVLCSVSARNKRGLSVSIVCAHCAAWGLQGLCYWCIQSYAAYHSSSTDTAHIECCSSSASSHFPMH